MKRILLIIICLSTVLHSFAQKKVEKEVSMVVDEGKLLYRMEMASWYGTDVFLEKFGDRKLNLGGYFSYLDNDLAKCVLFSNAEIPVVIATVSFDSTYNIKNAKVDGTERSFTKRELDIYTVRKLALLEINVDTFFKTYSNTNLNLIPLITENERKIFIVTGPEKDGMIIFGNDYVLTYDKRNELESKRRIHKNIIVTEFAEGQTGGYHVHLASTGEFITSTDICTLMLYEKFAKWEQYIVVSEKHVSIWNCKTDQLVTMTRDAWDRMSKENNKK